MLGRQQIAGIPTAIHELFKNAHDAYAVNVRVDFFHSDDMLILRDDGLGMTREDFEGRWLTLGTESKVGANDIGREIWTGPNSAPPRSVTGEKGIGRLAIAAIGPQVLVLTRAIRQDGLHHLVASLIHWGVFEIPGIDLDLIEVPIIEVPNGKIPSASDISKLAARVASNIQGLGDRVASSARNSILADLSMIDFDPQAIYKQLDGPILEGENYGTHFIIRPTSPVLADDIRISADRGTEATPLEKMLLGFGNTMMSQLNRPDMSAQFFDHREDGTSEDTRGLCKRARSPFRASRVWRRTLIPIHPPIWFRA